MKKPKFVRASDIVRFNEVADALQMDALLLRKAVNIMQVVDPELTEFHLAFEWLGFGIEAAEEADRFSTVVDKTLGPKTIELLSSAFTYHNMIAVKLGAFFLLKGNADLFGYFHPADGEICYTDLQDIFTAFQKGGILSDDYNEYFRLIEGVIAHNKNALAFRGME